MRRFAILAVLSLAACTAAGVDELGSTGEAIIGGSPDVGHQAVAILVWPDHLCSGTLITSKLVLTAAHCVDGGGDTAVAPTVVKFGRTLDDSEGVDVAGAYVHPEYDVADILNDIGVVELKRRSPVTPIPPHFTAPRQGDDLVLVGYGKQGEEADAASGKKLMITMPITAVTDQVLVVARSVCSGDSGGPALFAVDGKEKVAGIISYGDSCHSYGASQRVDIHRAWLEGIIAQHDPPSCELDFRCKQGCPAGDADCPCLATDGVCSALCTDPESDPDCPRGCGRGDSCLRGATCPAPDPDCGDPCGGEGHCLEQCPTRDPDCPAPKPTGAGCAKGFDCTGAATCLAGVCTQVCDPASSTCGKNAVCTRLTPEVAVCQKTAGADDGGGCSTGGRTGSPWLLVLLLPLLARRRAGVTALLLLASATALADPPSPARASGDAALLAHRYREAARAYQRAAADHPEDAEAGYRLGVAFTAAGELARAVTAWESVLGIDPLHERARRNLELARPRLAVPGVARPDDRRTLERARVLTAGGRASSALLLLETAAEAPDVLALRAEARLWAGDVSGALDAARSLLALEPASPRPYRLLAAAHRAGGDLARAAYFDGLGN